MKMINKYHKFFSGYFQHKTFEGQLSLYNANYFIAIFGGHENVPFILESIINSMMHDDMT